jgi:thioredoxin reductase (NADPH)
MENIYDLIIIGTGPAGLSASLYASRYKLNHLIIGTASGGQVSEISKLENYPGFVSISGKEFIGKLVEQIENFGMKLTHEPVSSIKKEGNVFVVETSAKNYQTKSIILAMGAEYRRINIPGEKELTGKGVSYCATCDALFFRNKIVSVIGGGNSAAVTALELADHAAKVYVIFRKDKMTAEPIWLDKINANSKIELVGETNVIEIKGEKKVEKIILDKARDDKTYLEVDGVFVEVGSDPGIALCNKLGVAIDEQSYIIVNPDMSTSIPGVFAAGDVTTGSNKFRQVITACAEGSIAASSAYKMLKLK